MKLLQKKQHPARRSMGAAAGQGDGRATVAELNERYAFRRNRTLTGSLSSNVTSINEHRSELKSARVQIHNLRRHRRRLFGWLVIVAAMTVLIGYLVYQSIAIPRVTIAGQHLSTPQRELYERSIQEYLNAHIFERNRQTLDTDALASYLQLHGFPEVKSVSSEMSFVGIGVAGFTIEARQPVISWKAGSSVLFVDQTGAAFEKNYFAAPSVEVVDQTGIQAQDNRILASNRFLSFIGRIIGRLSSEGLRVTKVVLPENTTRQIIVSIDGVSYPIKFSVDRPAGQQAEDAVRAVRHLSSKGAAVEYLDVRVKGKAFYK